METITPPMPAKRALAALDQPVPAEPIPAKRISAKVRRAVDLMVTGECRKICDAAAKVGLARESLSRALSTPHVAEHLRRKVLRYKAKAEGRYKGRPEDVERNAAIGRMLAAKQSWREIQNVTGCSRATIAKIAKRIKRVA